MLDRPHPPVVAVRDRASGRYLGAGAWWSSDAADALHLDEQEAAGIVRRFACEAEAIEVVPVATAVDGESCRAVA